MSSFAYRKFLVENTYVSDFLRTPSFLTYIIPALVSLLTVMVASSFNIGSLAIVSCGIAGLVTGSLLVNMSSFFSKQPTVQTQSQDENNSFPLRESSRAFTLAYGSSNNKGSNDIGSNYKKLLLPFLKDCYAQVDEIPDKIIGNLPTYALILPICAFSELNKAQYPSSLIFESEESYKKQVYFLPLIHEPEGGAKNAIISLFRSIKALSADKRPPRITFPLGCPGSVPHVVTAVVDFSKEGDVSCLIFDPLSSGGYRAAKDSLLQSLKAVFPGKQLKVREPDMRLERYDMTKCAVWCFTFHEFLTSVSVSCAHEVLGDKFLAFVDSKYNKSCEEHDRPVSTDPEQKERSFMGMQYEYMKSLVCTAKMHAKNKLGTGSKVTP